MDEPTKGQSGQPVPNILSGITSPPSSAPSGTDLKFAANADRKPTPPVTAPSNAYGPRVPTPPQSSIPPLSVKPAATDLNKPSVAQQGFTSSIRTMADDISKLKVGQKPSGESIQKTVSVEAPSTPPVIPRPTITPISPRSQLELGKAEKTQPLSAPGTGVKTTPVSPIQSAGPTLGRPTITPGMQVSVPPATGGQSGLRRFLLFAGIIIILVCSGYIIFLTLRNGSKVAIETPTPSQRALPSITPTPSQAASIASVFAAPIEEAELANTGNPTQDLRTRINAFSIQSREFKQLAIRTASKGAEILSAQEVFDRLLISYPPALRNVLGSDSAIFAYGQEEMFDSKGVKSIQPLPSKRFVFIFELKDPEAARMILGQWEPDMAKALLGLLDSNPAISTGVLDNTYQGVPIRFQNFHYPSTSIDYSIFASQKTGKSYLVIAGSREAMYATIEKLH